MHAEGWNHYFERLERLATTGDAGQDEWAFAPENLTPITAAEAALAVLQPILRNLTSDDRPKPTPCTEFTCHELAEHLFGSLDRVGAMAGATGGEPGGGLAGEPRLGDGRPGHRRVADRRPRRLRARSRRLRDARVDRRRDPADRARAARLGPGPGQRAAGPHLRRARRLRAGPGRDGRARRPRAWRVRRRGHPGRGRQPPWTASRPTPDARRSPTDRPPTAHENRGERHDQVPVRLPRPDDPGRGRAPDPRADGGGHGRVERLGRQGRLRDGRLRRPAGRRHAGQPRTGSPPAPARSPATPSSRPTTSTPPSSWPAITRT